MVLPSFVQDDISLIKAATQALEQIYRKGFAYAKAGIMAFDLAPKGQEGQLDLFSRHVEEPFQSEKLWEALDLVNKRYGRGTVFSAACGKGLTWKDQKKHLSQPYTTSWHHLPLVFAK
jgi:DNA polymerase V